MDGTIVETNHHWDRATQDLLAVRGVDCSPEMYAQLRKQLNGCALKNSCSLLKQMFDLSDPVEHLIQEKSHRARELYRQGIKFVDGFEQFHEKISKNQLPTGIATNADDATLAFTREALKLDKFFGEHQYAISAVGHQGKPDPAIFLYVADKLGIAPEHCVVIEDSPHGIEAARRAGMYTIGINTNKDRDNIAHAHRVVEGYDEINFLNL